MSFSEFFYFLSKIKSIKKAIIRKLAECSLQKVI